MRSPDHKKPVAAKLRVMRRRLHLEAQRLQLHGIGGGKGRKQAPLVGEVLHDALAVELRSRARITQRDGHANLGRVDRPLRDQHAPCATHKHQSGRSILEWIQPSSCKPSEQQEKREPAAQPEPIKITAACTNIMKLVESQTAAGHLMFNNSYLRVRHAVQRVLLISAWLPCVARLQASHTGVLHSRAAAP